MSATQDLFHNVATVAPVDPQNIASDTTTNGSSLETDDAMSVMFVMQVGNHSGGKFNLNVQESPDDSTWSDVDDADLHGTESGTTLSKAGVASIGYDGGEQYVRANVVSANGANADVSVAALKGTLYHAPDSDQRVS